MAHEDPELRRATAEPFRNGDMDLGGMLMDFLGSREDIDHLLILLILLFIVDDSCKGQRVLGEARRGA